MARARRGGGSFFGFLSSLVWTALLFGLAAFVFLAWEVHRPGPAARDTAVVVERGAGVMAIGRTLEARGVVRSAYVFRIAAELYAGKGALKAGEYEVEAGESLRSVLEKIESGRMRLFAVTVPEGRTSADIVKIIAEAPFLSGETPPAPPEGSLLPETYMVPRGMDRSALLQRMRDDHDKALQELWARRSPAAIVKTPEEAVILASIVEKETGLAAERPEVAAIFTNRLRRGMRLESDPTIIYGVCQCSRLTDAQGKSRGIRRSELDRRTAYNTYQIDGLPPGPIANPGRAAMEAVLNPPQSDALFFVALHPCDPSQGHAFSATYEAHNAAVTRLREAERALGGSCP